MCDQCFINNYAIKFNFKHDNIQTVTLVALALVFSYVFIPILPAALLEFLSAPTPYIMGVHESYKDVAPDLVRKLKIACRCGEEMT